MPQGFRPLRHKASAKAVRQADRIRAWRSEAIRAAAPGAVRTGDIERVFASRPDGERGRLARQLRRERVLGAGQGDGYDLGRHAALARALAIEAAGKRKAPRG